MTQRLIAVHRTINAVIDLPASTQDNIQVFDGIDATLDQLREQYDHLAEDLARLSEDDVMAGFVPSFIDNYVIIYMPQLGYLCRLIEVDVSAHQDELQEWEWKFSADGFAYYKNTRTLQLDDCKNIRAITTRIICQCN